MNRSVYELTDMFALVTCIGFVLLFLIVLAYRYSIKREIKDDRRLEENEKRLQKANSLILMLAALFAVTLIGTVIFDYMEYGTIKSEIMERGPLTYTDDEDALGAVSSICENGLLIDVTNETDLETEEYVKLANLQYEQWSSLTFTDFMDWNIKSFLHEKWEDGIVTDEDMKGL